MFIEQENFLTTEECQKAIRIFEDYFDYGGLGSVHRDTSVFPAYGALINYHNYFPEIAFIQKIMALVSYNIQKIDREAFVNYFQIVKWPTNSQQVSHKDFYEHPYTSIIYLNDDYDGGNTFIGSTVITPKVGKIVTFNGSLIEHGVLSVTRGIRYTIPVWYTMDSKLIDRYMSTVDGSL